MTVATCLGLHSWWKGAFQAVLVGAMLTGGGQRDSYEHGSSAAVHLCSASPGGVYLADVGVGAVAGLRQPAVLPVSKPVAELELLAAALLLQAVVTQVLVVCIAAAGQHAVETSVARVRKMVPALQVRQHTAGLDG